MFIHFDSKDRIEWGMMSCAEKGIWHVQNAWVKQDFGLLGLGLALNSIVGVSKDTECTVCVHLTLGFSHRVNAT